MTYRLLFNANRGIRYEEWQHDTTNLEFDDGFTCGHNYTLLTYDINSEFIFMLPDVSIEPELICRTRNGERYTDRRYDDWLDKIIRNRHKLMFELSKVTRNRKQEEKRRTKQQRNTKSARAV